MSFNTGVARCAYEAGFAAILLVLCWNELGSMIMALLFSPLFSRWWHQHRGRRFRIASAGSRLSLLPCHPFVRVAWPLPSLPQNTPFHAYRQAFSSPAPFLARGLFQGRHPAPVVARYFRWREGHRIIPGAAFACGASLSLASSGVIPVSMTAIAP